MADGTVTRDRGKLRHIEQGALLTRRMEQIPDGQCARLGVIRWINSGIPCYAEIPVLGGNN